MAFAYKDLREVRQKFNNLMILIISFFNFDQLFRIVILEILFLVNGHEGVC